MLRILSDKKKNQFYNEMIGKELEVLFESQNEDGIIKGFTSNYVRVKNIFDKNLVNQIAVVKINEIQKNLAVGQIKEMKNSVALETFTV